MSQPANAPTLRDYQQDTMTRVRHSLRDVRSVLLQLATGGGKSVIAAHMMRSAAKQQKTSWLMCHRKELIEQLSEHLRENGVSHGIIAAGHPRTHDEVQVASVQTLVRRLDDLPPPDLLVIDEAHHATAATYRKIIDHCKDSWHVGLTATPQRTDGTGLGDIFSDIVHGPSVADLTRRGYLTPYRLIAPPHPIDTSGLHSRGGDFVKKELEHLVDQGELTGRAVTHYMKYVHPHTCLVYCVTRAHAHHVTGAYQAAGINAAYVAGDTPAVERRALVDGFRKGDPAVIVSVDLFGEGLDAPGLRAVQLLRPTKSLILHLQQIGRALRIEEGKEHAIVLDHAGNSWLHGLPDDPRVWSLEGRDKKAKSEVAISLRHCPECFSIYRARLGACPRCGWVPKVVERILEESDEELQEIAAEQHRIHRRREEGQTKGLEALVRLAQQRGYKAGWAARRQAHRSGKPFQQLINDEHEIRRGN